MIVYILADALRPDHLSCYKGKVNTPNIDSLAKEGVLCQNMYANSNATEPCITTILTGHYVHEHGILVHPRYTTFSETAQQRVNPAIEDHHLCQLFRKEGIRTVLFDMLSIFNEPYFDDYFQVKSDIRVKTKGQDTLKLLKDNLAELSPNTFIFIHFWDTHHPYFPDYEGEVKKLDEEVGELLGMIDLDKDTVVFSADHGESIGEHVTEARATDPGHHHLYEEIVRIPFIIHTPLTKGKVISKFQEEIDILPTILAKHGIVYQREWFTPNAQTVDSELAKNIVFFEEHTYQQQIGFRTAKWKYMEKIGDLNCPLCNVIHGGGKYELYDLEQDPKETYNIASLQEAKTLNNFSLQAWAWYNVRHL